MNKTPSDWIRPEIRGLSSYHVPPAKGMIKLDAMENPYDWPEDLQKTWLERIKEVPLNRYPDPAGKMLCERLRETMEVPAGQEIMLGNGSDELIQVIAMAIAEKGRVILAPEPSFVMYKMIATFVGLDYVGVPLKTEDFSLDLQVMLTAIKQHKPAIIFLAYPNNPTGNHWDRAAIEKIIEQAPGLVVLDEAYAPFATDSFMQDLNRYPNLLVMHTLSKFGLAGIRLGYLCGAPEWLNEFDKIRLPYNINSLTQMTAEFALENKKIFDDQADLIKTERKVLIAAMNNISGLKVFQSDANFILFKTPVGQAKTIFESLQAQNILIKNLSASDGALQDCLRVTVGRPDENKRFIAGLSEAVQTAA